MKIRVQVEGAPISYEHEITEAAWLLIATDKSGAPVFSAYDPKQEEIDKVSRLTQEGWEDALLREEEETEEAGTSQAEQDVLNALAMAADEIAKKRKDAQ